MNQPHIKQPVHQPNNPEVKKLIREDKKVRKNITEDQIDKMIKDSFPASDPPASY